MGDRECSICGEISLIEEGIDKWVCLNCNEVFDESYLDDIED